MPLLIVIFGTKPYFFCMKVEPPLAKTPSGLVEFPKTWTFFFF